MSHQKDNMHALKAFKLQMPHFSILGFCENLQLYHIGIKSSWTSNETIQGDCANFFAKVGDEEWLLDFVLCLQIQMGS